MSDQLELCILQDQHPEPIKSICSRGDAGNAEKTPVLYNRFFSYKHNSALRTLRLSEITAVKPVVQANLDGETTDRVREIRSRPLITNSDNLQLTQIR